MRAGWYLIILCSAGVAHADEVDETAIQTHAFVSQGALLSSDNNYLAESESGSFEFTEAGINFTKQLSDRLRTGMQLFTRDLGPTGDFKIKLDWAYFDYHLTDELGIRAGRTKLPFGLYNDVSDIDAARPTVLLPPSVYPTTSRDYLLAQTGLELYGYRHSDHLGALDYRAYIGTINLELPQQSPNSPAFVDRLAVPYVAGARVMWETPHEGLRIGASFQRLKFEYDATVNLPMPAPPAKLSVTIPVNLAVASLEYTRDAVLFAAEYSRWSTDATSSNMMLFPNTKAVEHRAYWLAAFRASPRFQLAAYYSVYYPERARDAPDTASSKLHDTAATLRIDLHPNWILKLEAHQMRGTASLNAQLNPGETLDTLADHWLLFLAKTTVYF